MSTSNMSIEDVNPNMVLITKHWPESTVENTSDISFQNAFNIDPLILISLKAFESIRQWKVKVLLSVIYATGTIANSTLLAYLVYYKRYKSPIFCVILSLCMSDLGVCLASMARLGAAPIMLVPLWMCNVYLALLFVSYLTSSYHIVLVAGLRFFQLVYPLASQAHITVSLMCKICLSIWAVDFIQGLTLASFFKITELEYRQIDIYVCTYAGNRFIYNIWVALTWTALPFLTTAGLHVSKHVILICTRTASLAMTSTGDGEQRGRKRTDSRALALVLILYLVSIVPTIVMYLLYSLFGISRGNISAWNVKYIAEFISLTNSAINPWVYMFASESVRSDIRKMCFSG